MAFWPWLKGFCCYCPDFEDDTRLETDSYHPDVDVLTTVPNSETAQAVSFDIVTPEITTTNLSEKMFSELSEVSDPTTSTRALDRDIYISDSEDLITDEVNPNGDIYNFDTEEQFVNSNEVLQEIYLVGEATSEQGLSVQPDIFTDLFTTVANSLNFEFISELQSGANGRVAKMRDLVNQTSAAVKIERFGHEQTMDMWASLNHPNVLPLHFHFSLGGPLLNMPTFTVSIMPCLVTDLQKISESQGFRNDSQAFQHSRRWIRQVAEGVEYLHRSGFFHGDLKENNIFVDNMLNAVIGDFTFLTTETVVRRSYSPAIYRAPETSSFGAQLSSELLDMWALGVACLNLLTGSAIFGYLDDQYVEATYYQQATLHLIRSLKESQSCFSDLLKRAYPTHVFSSEEGETSWHFIQTALIESQHDRNNASAILKHTFLN